MKTTIGKAPAIGFILFQGVNAEGVPYSVVATLESSNTKTGNMVTVWIIRTDAHPSVARAESKGKDHPTCLDCPLAIAGCYVQIEHAPAAVWRALMAGRYVPYNAAIHAKLLKRRSIRWGGYGDPVLIPLPIVEDLSALCVGGWTGYTHQWAKPDYQGYRRFFMASVHSIAQRDRAWAKGWRTFRDCTTLEAEPIGRGEMGCPAAKENGERLQCIDCMICNGNDRAIGHKARASVVIVRHANAVQTKILAKALRTGAVSFA